MYQYLTRPSMRPLTWVGAILLAFLFSMSFAYASEDDLGGTIEAVTPDGQSFHLPMVDSDIEAMIDGDIASIKIRQVFENPSTGPVNATYLFPLNEDAAIHAMTMTVGDEIIRADIQKKAKARETFERAKQAGKSAALLSQHRPNMFTQDVANLMPEQPVIIELTYAQIIPFKDHAYELVVPTVVGPRYMPAAPKSQDEFLISTVSDRSSDTGDSDEGTDIVGSASGNWVLGPPPSYPDVKGLTIPKSIDPNRLSFQATVRSGVDIQNIHSASHTFDVQGKGRESFVSLANGRTIPNRDLILRYELGGEGVQAGALTHIDERGGFFSLMLTPPDVVDDRTIASRELVFVLDTSGSMNGLPIKASKTFMHEALEALRPEDAFRVVQFSSTASEFSRVAVPATKRNVSAGRNYVDRLQARGGTEIVSALNQAFSLPETAGRMRIVIFLTDGYIGNEIDVLRRQAELMGDSRVYAFGVGSSVNRYLLEEMARRGRGMVRYVDPTETAGEAAKALARNIEAPVLTDVSIDWGEMNSEFVTPNPIPDLFAGEAIRLTGRFDPKNMKGPTEIKISGRVAGRKATLPVKVSLQNGDRVSALPVIWARQHIGDLMSDLAAPQSLRVSGLTDHGIESDVTELGLNFDLVTQWTSFVAVSEKTINSDEVAKDLQVALERPAGVPNTAFGRSDIGMSRGGFAGASSPEPGFWFMLILAALGGLFIYLRRGREIMIKC